VNHPSRKPKGYSGRQHETLGLDISAVVRVLKLPEQVLGEEECQRLRASIRTGGIPSTGSSI
jgi:hypothetical protein